MHTPVIIFVLFDYSVGIRGACSHIEVKEKRSSNASLKLMNPVASGDNMAVDLAQKKEELPPIVPCCEGRELQVGYQNLSI